MMKRLMFLILSLAVLIGMGLATSAAIAGEGVYGQMRWRWEGFKDYDGDSDADDNYGFNSLRARIGYKTMVGERGFFNISFDHVRTMAGDVAVSDFGDIYEYEMDKGGLFYNDTDDDAIYLHTAYFGMQDFIVEDFTAKAGRFSLAYGRERIIGREDWLMDWENRFDGFMGHYKFEQGWLDLLCLWLEETYQQKYFNGRGDSTLRGAYLHYDVNEDFYFEPYILWAAEAHQDVMVGVDEVAFDSDSIFMFGALVDYMMENGLHLYAEGMMESGTLHEIVGTEQAEVDLSAMGFYAGVFYQVDNEMEPFFGVEFNYASGDDEEDDEIKDFMSPFGSTADYMGRMNFVDWSNTSSFRFAAGFTPTENLDVKLDFYLFKLAKDSYLFAGTTDPVEIETALGNEIDLFIDYMVEENVTVEAGLGIFSYGDAYEYEVSPGEFETPDSSWFAWLGAQVAFP